MNIEIDGVQREVLYTTVVERIAVLNKRIDDMEGEYSDKLELSELRYLRRKMISAI